MGLLEEFNGLTAEEISNYPKYSKEEHVQLEFKTINNSNMSVRDDRKNFAKSISGFANSSGGLVIWGVDARKNEQAVDAAVATAEIDQLGLFCSRLNELSNQATQPSVEGLVHRKLETAADKGFVVSYVPESTAVPHMAKLGEDRYYKRNGTSFLKLEHYDLEDMFGRRQRPNLEISVVNRQATNDFAGELVEINILNIGRGIAKHVGFLVEVVGANVLNARQPLQNVSSLNPGRQFCQYSNDVNVIHPNSIQTQIGSFVAAPTLDDNFRLVFQVYCEHMPSKRTEFTITLKARDPVNPIL